MFVVELQQRALAVADLEEAHHAAVVVALLDVGVPALHLRRDPLGHHGRLEVRRGARL
jgi:hypothetical protein